MSDHEEKNVNQPDGEEFDFSSMSIDELIASTKEEIARIDEMMGTSRLPDAEEAAEELPQEAPKKEREQAKGAEIDIERLMREMTKRLWEEREASGRRLRR